MKRYIYLLAILSAFVINATAQNLLAFHIVGNVTYKNGTKMLPLVMNTRIPANTVISIPVNGKVEFLDEVKSKRICISKPGNGPVSSLAKEQGNSISDLAGRYVAYVKKQMTNNGLTSKQRYTDFATVTRKVETKKPHFNSQMDSIMWEFKHKIRLEFEAARAKYNNEYTDFVRQIWKEYRGEPVTPMPKDQMIKPVVKHDTVTTNRLAIFDKIAKLFKPKKQLPPKVEEEVKEEMKMAEKQPEPVIEIMNVEPVKPEEKKEAEEFEQMPVTLFGTEFTVRLGEHQRFNLGTVEPNRVADALDYLSSKNFDNLLFDCLKIRKDNNLCDWAYLLLLKNIADQFCGAGTNEAALLTGWLYYQSGYKMRYAYDEDKHLYILIASKHYMYDKKFPYSIDGEFYYPLDSSPQTLYFCQAKFPKERSLSLFLKDAPSLNSAPEQKRTLRAQYHYPEISVEVGVNPNLLAFYDSYPASCIDNNFTTRWQMYANTPLDEDVKAQIYPTLEKELNGYSKKEAAARLLDLVQSIKYEYDDSVWGGDRAFFAEESLHYPSCDCEDRSILFTRLVRDILHLPCVLIYYPGHLASAVHFDDGQCGAVYEYQGTQYTLCDGTYLGAEIGEQMEQYDREDNGAVVIPIQ